VCESESGIGTGTFGAGGLLDNPDATPVPTPNNVGQLCIWRRAVIDSLNLEKNTMWTSIILNHAGCLN
jgi:hypothetical protein